MAILDESNRFECWVEYMKDNLDDLGLTKADLRAVINAVDQWADDNASSFNSAIPQPARSIMTARQKAMMLMAVAAKRFGVA